MAAVRASSTAPPVSAASSKGPTNPAAASASRPPDSKSCSAACAASLAAATAGKSAVPTAADASAASASGSGDATAAVAAGAAGTFSEVKGLPRFAQATLMAAAATATTPAPNAHGEGDLFVDSGGGCGGGTEAETCRSTLSTQHAGLHACLPREAMQQDRCRHTSGRRERQAGGGHTPPAAALLEASLRPNALHAVCDALRGEGRRAQPLLWATQPWPQALRAKPCDLSVSLENYARRLCRCASSLGGGKAHF